MNFTGRPFSSFVSFVQGELDGTCWDDAAYRAFDLDAMSGEYGVRQALELLKRSLLEIKDDLDRLGLPSDDLKGRLTRWRTWYKVSTFKSKKGFRVRKL